MRTIYTDRMVKIGLLTPKVNLGLIDPIGWATDVMDSHALLFCLCASRCFFLVYQKPACEQSRTCDHTSVIIISSGKRGPVEGMEIGNNCCVGSEVECHVFDMRRF